MKLITEINEEIQYLTEATVDGKKNFYVEGIIMQGDIKNRNGRIYPSQVLVKEMNRYNQTNIAKNRAFGELGHPQGPTINLDRVSHLFTELRQDGSNIVGKAKIIDTPMGKIVQNLMSEKAQLGISSRGLGSVKENKQGIMEVQDDFMLATAGDIVADPSAPSAFLNGIMEGVEYWFNVADGSIREVAVQNTIDEIVEEVKEIKREYSSRDVKKLEEQAITLFKKYIRSL